MGIIVSSGPAVVRFARSTPADNKTASSANFVTVNMGQFFLSAQIPIFFTGLTFGRGGYLG